QGSQLPAPLPAAVWNFPRTKEHHLPLQIGEMVHILQASEGWYCGYSLRNRAARGIFPASLIRLKGTAAEQRGPEESAVPSDMPMVQEITTTLREWAAIWKQLYVAGQTERYGQVKRMMQELMEQRSQLLSGTLPKDQLLRLRKECHRGKGHIPLLSWHAAVPHGTAHPCPASGAAEVTGAQPGRAGACAAIGDTLGPRGPWDGGWRGLCHPRARPEHRPPRSENYVIRWASTGVPQDIELLNNLRVVFTDLGSADLKRERLFLVCHIVRVGRMDLRDSHSRKLSTGLRRPFGISVMDITDISKGTCDSDEDKQHFIPVHLVAADGDFLHTMIRKAAEGKDINHKGQGLWVSLKVLWGDLSQVRKDHPHLVDRSTAVARKLGYPEVIMPGKRAGDNPGGDVRNDIYLTLVQGEFDKGSKKTQKNVEVTVCVCDEAGNVVQNVIHAGAGDSPSSYYRSIVYYQQRHQRWMETLKIAVPIEDVHRTHLRFTFRHRSSSDSWAPAPLLSALTQMPSIQTQQTPQLGPPPAGDAPAVPMLCPQGDSRKLEDASAYLALPWERNAPEPRLPSGSSFRAPGAAAALAPSGRDSFQISTLVCSTKLTQNVNLLGLLKWRSKPSLLCGNLQKLMNVDGGEVIKFLQDTLDALFSIMMEHSDTDVYDTLVFDALVFIVRLVADRKFQHFNTVLEAYIRQHFSATLAYKKLLSVLTQYVEQAGRGEPCESLPRTFKALEYIFKFIVRSRRLFAQLYEGKEVAEFQRSLQRFFLALNQLMQSPLEGPTLLSQ
ncbi:DOCK2 protein, partial [Calcarius ornatus]|nr:DOCK2 protein [Calcarius ornatus]